MRLEARAKINWTLDILGQRPDGYHLMDMLMQPITLCDEITLLPAREITLTTSGTPAIAPNARNLAYRAAMALKAETGCPLGAALHVHKRIPSGAGLGGGSADAAAVLYGLNLLWNTGLSPTELERIGLTLGADVPFCLRGGLARVTGIGEAIRSLPSTPTWPLVILQPCKALSTKAVFQAYHAAATVHHPRTEEAQAALLSRQLTALAPALGNALESVSCAARPAIGEALDALLHYGAVAASMSGSGSAVFGVFDTKDTAQHATEILRARWPRTFLCTSCADSLHRLS